MCKKKIDSMFYLLTFSGAILMVAAVLPFNISVIAICLAVALFAGMVILVKKIIKRELVWRSIFRACCENLSYTDTVLGGGKFFSGIAAQLFRVSGVEDVWIVIKEEDGVFRLQTHAGVGVKDSIKFRRAEDYTGEDPDAMGSQYFFKDEFRGIKGKSFLHIPVVEGEILYGFLSICANRRRVFEINGINNFLVLADLIRKFWGSYSKEREMRDMSRRMRSEVEAATDELTRTNLRLISRVKELRSLYGVSLKVFMAENTDNAVNEVFEHVARLINGEYIAYMELFGDKFVTAFSHKVSSENGEPELQKIEFPVDALANNSGMIITRNTVFDEVAPLFEQLGLVQLLAAAAKTGNDTKGVLMVGSRKEYNYSQRDMEMVSVYASLIADYIEKNRLLDRVITHGKQLEVMGKMRDNFIALISHELKTPLTSIKGYGEMLINGEAGKVGKQQTEFLKIIIDAASELEDKINDIIYFKEDGGSLTRDMFDYRKMVSDTVEEYGIGMKEKNIVSSLEVPSSGLQVYGDRTMIKKAMGNILSNSVKFTPEKGKIDIWVTDAGDFVKTEIKDNGVGMSSDMKKYVFDKFVQEESPKTRNMNGLGIGLATSKKIIESHGGKIDIESSKGAGTKVTYILPYGTAGK